MHFCAKNMSAMSKDKEDIYRIKVVLVEKKRTNKRIRRIQ